MGKTLLVGFRAIIIGLFLFAGAGCEKAFDLKEPKSNAVAIFEELWKVMNERYALFDIKAVDWKSQYTQYRGLVDDTMTDTQLFHLLDNMLETLRDGHVSLISAQDTATYDYFYKAFPANFNYPTIVANYLQGTYKTTGPVIYKIASDIGYLYYNSFYNDISNEQIDNIINDLSATKGLIIDVRSNTGGRSGNVDKLFSRFIQEKRLVKYEVLKKGTGHTDFLEPEPFYVAPSGTAYTKPIVVLTNRSCFSACNDFVSYMSALPNVKLMGDQTGGGGSVPYTYILANGWRVYYSASITLSAEKVSIDNGILPDVDIVITPIDETNGRDPIIERAFESLQ